jgi:peptidoglycan/LPS O-acetylase OafA/YrhL
MMVWYGHCFALYGGMSDPLGALISVESFGGLGVKIFFIVSGYFVTASYDHHKTLRPYIKNRALRLLPALIMVVLLSVFVLGPAATTLKLSSYFLDTHTWNYLSSILVFPMQYDLPGVFMNNPKLHAVNGSLWSLQHEVRCYVYVAILGALGLLHWRVILALYIGLWLCLFYGTLADAGTLPHVFFLNRWSWGKTELALNLVMLFCGGALLYLARAYVSFRWKYLAIVLLTMAISTQLPHGDWLFELGLIYGVICIGFLHVPCAAHFGKYGDFSYGIYLYAFPMQQLVLYLMAGCRFSVFCLTSLLLTLVCAIASWHLIEKRALSYKVQSQSKPNTQAA